MVTSSGLPICQCTHNHEIENFGPQALEGHDTVTLPRLEIASQRHSTTHSLSLRYCIRSFQDFVETDWSIHTPGGAG